MERERLPSRRLETLYEFVLSHLPSAPAGILEVGCGRGELALALSDAGYAVTAIDPEAPEGPIFSRTRLENLATEARFDAQFDAVVASVSLHHVDDLAAAFDAIERVLRPGGLLVVEEFAKERFTGATARWYYHQRRALEAVGIAEAPLPDDFDAWLREWEREHADIHPLTDLRRELDARFAPRHCGWGPYLFDYGLRDALEPLERELIEAGAIDATGFRFVGERRG